MSTDRDCSRLPVFDGTVKFIRTRSRSLHVVVHNGGSFPPWNPYSDASFRGDGEKKFHSFGSDVSLPLWQILKVAAHSTIQEVLQRPHSLVRDHAFGNGFDFPPSGGDDVMAILIDQVKEIDSATLETLPPDTHGDLRRELIDVHVGISRRWLALGESKWCEVE